MALTYYEKNKEKCKARQALYYKANKEKIEAYRKTYREANKGKIKAYWRAFYKGYQRGERLMRKYGVSLEQYEESVRAQKGRCAICKRKPKAKPLCVDHDHRTGRFRGLLCHTCNSGLGYFQDRGDWVQAAAKYLG